MFTLRTQKKEFRLEDVEQWLARKDDHHRVTAIDLPGKRINDDTAMLINSLAMRCWRIQLLKLDRNLISDVGATSLAEAIPHFKSCLVHLDLSGNRITASGADEVARAYLSDLQGLGEAANAVAEAAPRGPRILDLSHNALADRGVVAVARHLGAGGEGVRLRMREVGCGQPGVNALLPCREALAELDLSLNPITAAGAAALCREVCGAGRWRSLGLSHLHTSSGWPPNGRSSNLVTAFMDCARGAAQLRELDCGGNGLGDYGGRMIIEALHESDPHTLERLSMGESGCGIQTSNALQTTLRKRVPRGCPSAGLRVLELPSNRLNDECAAVLAEGVARSQHLMRLLLARNAIGDRGAADLARGLELQRSNRELPPGYDQPGCVVDLDLATNPIGDDGASALAQAALCSREAEARRFQVPWGLERLHLAETDIGTRGRDALCTAVACRAALAENAADFLGRSSDDTLLRNLRARRARMPSGLEILGLGLQDAPAARMRSEAHSRLQELWPNPRSESPMTRWSHEPTPQRVQAPPAQSSSSGALGRGAGADPGAAGSGRPKLQRSNTQPEASGSWMSWMKRAPLLQKLSAAAGLSQEAGGAGGSGGGGGGGGGGGSGGGSSSSSMSWGGWGAAASAEPAVSGWREQAEAGPSRGRDGGYVRPPPTVMRHASEADERHVEQLGRGAPYRETGGGAPDSGLGLGLPVVSLSSLAQARGRAPPVGLSSLEESSDQGGSTPHGGTADLGAGPRLAGKVERPAARLPSGAEAATSGSGGARGGARSDAASLAACDGDRRDAFGGRAEGVDGEGSLCGRRPADGLRGRQLGDGKDAVSEGVRAGLTTSALKDSIIKNLNSCPPYSDRGTGAPPGTADLGAGPEPRDMLDKLSARTPTPPKRKNSGSDVTNCASDGKWAHRHGNRDGTDSEGSPLARQLEEAFRARNLGDGKEAIGEGVTAIPLELSEKDGNCLNESTGESHASGGAPRRDVGISVLPSGEPAGAVHGGTADLGAGPGPRSKLGIPQREGFVRQVSKSESTDKEGFRSQLEEAFRVRNLGEGKEAAGEAARAGVAAGFPELLENAGGGPKEGGNGQAPSEARGWAPDQSFPQDVSELAAQVERLQRELAAEKMARQAEAAGKTGEEEAGEGAGGTGEVPATAQKGKGKGTPPPRPPPPSAKGAAKGTPPRLPTGMGKGTPPKGPPPPGKAPPSPSAVAGGGAAAEGAPAAPEGGKALGKGKVPPPPKGVAPKGKAPVPGKAAAKPKAQSKAQAAVPKLLGETPFGRRIHFVQPTYEEPDGESIFGELGSGHELFDSELLRAMLSTGEQEKRGAVGGGRRKAITRRPTGIIVLDATRAQNMAIVLSKLKVSSEEMCVCLTELNFEDPRLNIDDVELLIMVLPTPEESKKLLEYKAVVDQLRDVEQKVMPFCTLPRSAARLKLMKFALSHASTYSGLLHRCQALRSAAEEARVSTQLRELLSVILRVGNFINHGVEEAREGTVRGFGIESLMTLASFKTGAVSTLHFLCLTMRSSDTAFLQDLKGSLQHVQEASREKATFLKAAIDSFQKECEFTQRETQQLDDESEGKGRMQTLVAALEQENATLKRELELAMQDCTDVQKFFSISEKAQANLPPPEQFFGHIASFLDAFSASWKEIEKNPKRWQQFAAAAGCGQQAQRKSMPSMPSSMKLTMAVDEDDASAPADSPTESAAKLGTPTEELSKPRATDAARPDMLMKALRKVQEGDAARSDTLAETLQKAQDSDAARPDTLAEALQETQGGAAAKPTNPKEALQKPQDGDDARLDNLTDALQRPQGDDARPDSLTEALQKPREDDDARSDTLKEALQKPQGGAAATPDAPTGEAQEPQGSDAATPGAPTGEPQEPQGADIARPDTPAQEPQRAEGGGAAGADAPADSVQAAQGGGAARPGSPADSLQMARGGDAVAESAPRRALSFTSAPVPL